MIRLDNGPAHVLAPRKTLDYFDIERATLPRAIAPLDAWNIIMEDPWPLLQLAFRIRDAISARFGVKRIGGFSTKRAESANVGERLDFFVVEHVDETSLVLTERDRHLDVMTCISVVGPEISITSSVRTHNLFGRLYMIPVGVAHRWIVRGMLRKLARKLA
ncbi:MAG: DUF2867 domain-containing protein [Pseudomonadota bacterium]